MLVDRIVLEYIINYYELLAMNKEGIRNNINEFVFKKYEEEYDYGHEYYFDYKVVNLQDDVHSENKRALIALLIYKDEEMAELQKECDERMESGL